MLEIRWEMIDESDRQATLLALAELALSRPGWGQYLRGIAEKLQGVEMFDGFKRTSADRIADLLGALEELVKLQAHYAKLLNMQDGGQRIAFESAEQWLARLKELKELKS